LILLTRWQFITLSILSLLPVLLLAGFGGWTLYVTGYWWWLWWTMPICWGLAALLWRAWGSRLEIPQLPLDRTHWTPQDQAATEIVKAEQQRVGDYTKAQLCDPQFYTQITQDLALKIAQHYYPKAQDPLGQRTVVEILAAVQLISEDVEEWFLKYVPGGHLVTVSQWRLLSHAPGWWTAASNAGWVASILLNPLNLGRYFVSKFAVDPLSGQVQQNLLGLFYTSYIRQAGYYLIELNSGRLQGGSERYRRWVQRLESPSPPPTATGPLSENPSTPVTITIALLGQVKAGKSSLANALVGQRVAATDVLPATKQVQRISYSHPDRGDRFVLLDTTGYSDAGATLDQIKETREAVRQADLVLLVLDARSPARDADVKTLSNLADWYASQPQLKPPPVLAVLNKIDGLSPVMEWSPPYNWKTPIRPKERNIAAAMDYIREVFGTKIKGVIPTCSDSEHDRVTGIDTDLVPAMAMQLDQARSAALLRELHSEFARDKYTQIAGQVWEIGKKLKDAVAEWPK
jgi:uncharacterized protein